MKGTEGRAVACHTSPHPDPRTRKRLQRGPGAVSAPGTLGPAGQKFWLGAGGRAGGSLSRGEEWLPGDSLFHPRKRVAGSLPFCLPPPPPQARPQVLSKLWRSPVRDGRGTYAPTPELVHTRTPAPRPHSLAPLPPEEPDPRRSPEPTCRAGREHTVVRGNESDSYAAGGPWRGASGTAAPLGQQPGRVCPAPVAAAAGAEQVAGLVWRTRGLLPRLRAHESRRGGRRRVLIVRPRVSAAGALSGSD